MKKILLSFFLAYGVTLFAQVSEGGLPVSYKNSIMKSGTAITAYTMQDIDVAALEKYDNQPGTPYRYALFSTVKIDIKKSGTITLLPDGGTLWQYRINSGNCKSTQVVFEKFIVPDEAQLYVFSSDYNNIKGAYTKLNMRDDQEFVVGDIPGNNIIVEYYEPATASFSGQVVIGGIGQAYIDIFNTPSSASSTGKYISINCNEGYDWQNQKHSVCKYTYNDGKYSYLCSGALINNTANDGTPYFLTANHCISKVAYASSVVAYFNYEDQSCYSSSDYVSQTLSGATLLSTGLSSDYTLLKFNNAVPASYQPYFAGWDISGTAAENTVGIHHPEGLKKMIAIDNDAPLIYNETISWEGGTITPASTHWAVTFDRGTTASGSSGSPLFDDEKRIIGQLHGGSDSDFYGMLSYSWSHPNDFFNALRTYLNVGTTVVETLDGYYPPENLPDAQFFSNFSLVCKDSPISLLGSSAFNATGWKWSFTPATVEYHNGTNENSQNPEVSFKESSTYAVGLTITNSAGSDNLTLQEFISSGAALNLGIVPDGMDDSCTCNFQVLYLNASGADAYQWTLSDASDDYFYIVSNTANPAEVRLKDGVTLKQKVNITATLTGFQGTCQSAKAISIPLEYQTNDDIENAITVTTGTNGKFSNSCASIQQGEPIPPHTSCTEQLSWCDEYGTGENIVENSVWFKYVPEANQNVRVSTTGFDDQIAVYKAQTYSDVLNGTYELVGANDDYSTTDFNPRITTINVKVGQNYWIQVDGSGGGLEGEFYLYITILSGINDGESVSDEIRVYPQPADDYLTIATSLFLTAETINVELFNSAGGRIYSDCFAAGSETVDIPLINIPSGIYFARITIDNQVFVKKVVRK